LFSPLLRYVFKEFNPVRSRNWSQDPLLTAETTFSVVQRSLQAEMDMVCRTWGWQESMLLRKARLWRALDPDAFSGTYSQELSGKTPDPYSAQPKHQPPMSASGFQWVYSHAQVWACLAERKTLFMARGVQNHAVEHSYLSNVRRIH